MSAWRCLLGIICFIGVSVAAISFGIANRHVILVDGLFQYWRGPLVYWLVGGFLLGIGTGMILMLCILRKKRACASTLDHAMGASSSTDEGRFD